MQERISDNLWVALQHLLPKHALTRLAGWLADARGGALTTWAIRRFARRYRVDMSEALDPELSHYPSFNAFFTRALRAQARALAHAPWISPVDGAVSQAGPMDGVKLLQAKGHHYSLSALLGGDAQMSAMFEGGSFATLYLSPRDYHRIHMPCDGRLLRMSHVPGALYSVNPTTARGIAGLFARNERVICLFETAYGPLAMILVGATIVGSMSTVWHGVVNPRRGLRVHDWQYEQQAIRLSQGQEMGRFLLGSTVILLWPSGVAKVLPEWTPQAPIRLGQALAERIGA